jgi:hypothetical protein
VPAKDFDLPETFDVLANFLFSKGPPTTRDQSARTDKAFKPPKWRQGGVAC